MTKVRDLLAHPTREKGVSLMTDSHSTALMAKHARLDAQITNERSRPSPDELLVAMLKKQKLRIKEALARLR
jgi:hypothetical protein